MRLARRIPRRPRAIVFALLLAVTGSRARAQSSGQLPDEWNDAVHSLADRISSALTPRPLSIEVRNISSVSPADAAAIQQGLQSELTHRGFHLTQAASSNLRIGITLSEGAEAYLFVADIPGARADEIAIVALKGRKASSFSAKPTPSLRSRMLFEQPEPILDFDQTSGPDRTQFLFVLESNRLARFELNGGTWEPRGSLPILETRLRPRDLRGHVIVSEANGIRVFLPGVSCTAPGYSSTMLDCVAEPDVSWPVGERNEFSLAPGRNYFGSHRPKSGWPLSYSIASQVSEGALRLVLTELGGKAQLFDDAQEVLATFAGWGDDVVSIAAGCRAGWQVLATAAGDWTEPDHIQLYEITGDQAVAQGQSLEFSGPVLALWPADDGKSARSVSRNPGTGFYEASIVSVTCGD
jgi:hypothetical protein